MLWFICGLLLSVIIHGALLVTVSPLLISFKPVYYHLLFMGWITQIIIGVSIWMFPRHTKAAPQGNEWVNWAIFITLNVGLLLRCVAEPLAVVNPDQVWSWSLFLSACLQICAGVLYVGNIWPRIKRKT